jgi:predicted AAA+ superfamily ATPase
VVAREQLASEAYDAALPWRDELARAFDRYLVVGGFPRAVADEAAGRPVSPALLDALFNGVFRYAFAASRSSEAETVDLLERLASGLGSPLSYADVARDVGSTPDTVARRVGELSDAYFIWPCPRRDDAGWRPQERAQGKLYFVDPLMARLAHLRNDGRLDPDPTVLAEAQIGTALRRRLESSEPGRFAEHDRLFHWRTPTRKEIDFVAEELGGAAIEGKYVDGGSWRRGAMTVDASQWHGILVTRTVLDCAPDDGSSWAVPGGMLAYLIDT